MRVEFKNKTENHLVFSISLTPQEIDRFLHGRKDDVSLALSEAFQAVLSSQRESRETKSVPAEAASPFVAKHYKNVTLKTSAEKKETIIEQILDIIIEANHITIPDETLQGEVNYCVTGVLQNMKYDAMRNGQVFSLEQHELENIKEEVQAGVIQDLKKDMILQSIIEQEHIEASPEELKQAADDLAKRKNMSLEMVQDFFGQDFSLLKNDVVNTKALNLIYDNANIDRESQKSV